jgi:PiT family inorganic phosphate transporter
MTDRPSPFEKPTLDKDLDRLSLIESATQFVLVKGAAPGLAFLFVIVSAIFAAMFLIGRADSLVIVLASAIAAYMAMNIGANDVTNNVGAAVGGKAISMAGALAIAAFAEIAGAMIAGNHVVDTIRSGILVPDAGISAEQTIVIMLAASVSASIWINLATWLNAPVSTTHSIVGGIMGAGAAVTGMAAVNWGILGEIAISWVASPFMGGLVAALFLWLIKETIIYREQKVEAAQFWVPVLLAMMTAAFMTYLLLTSTPATAGFRAWQLVLAGVFLGAISYVGFRDLVARQARELENRNQSLKILFRAPLIFAAALLSFAHGANDLANAIGPLSAIFEASRNSGVAAPGTTPFWIMAIGAFGISTGLLLFGPRLIRVVGSQITRLNPLRAYCVSMSAAVNVIIASELGMPVSSTHIAVGSVFGVGLFREWYTANSARRRAYIERRRNEETGETQEETKARQDDGDDDDQVVRQYRFLVRRSYLMSILAAWAVTVPASGLLAALLSLLIAPMFIPGA